MERVNVMGFGIYLILDCNQSQRGIHKTMGINEFDILQLCKRCAHLRLIVKASFIGWQSRSIPWTSGIVRTPFPEHAPHGTQKDIVDETEGCHTIHERPGGHDVHPGAVCHLRGPCLAEA